MPATVLAVLTTDQKGAIAETAVAHAALKLGIDVYRPVGDGGRYDLIFDAAAVLLRIQCKWVRLHGDVVIVRCYSSRRTRAGVVRRLYMAGEVDLIAAYCPDLERTYMLSQGMFDGRAQAYLRVSESLNHQRRGVNWADDFEFERLHWLPPGAVAQLGERRAGSAKVTGSSPVSSITVSPWGAASAASAAAGAGGS